MEYNFRKIEADWQKYWAENQTFKAENNSTKPKYYVLDMFPYPSGAGLHVGHPLGYIASDIYARYKRHKGFNVLHPQGYDSFGLPAEQYAIQTGQHPAITTEENIKTYRKQLDQIGFSFDWSREVRTSDPNYYKWTQWIFIQLFNSWYHKTTDKAEDISTLIAIFSAEGNSKVKAACDDTIEKFSADEWKNFSEEKQQKILLQYRLTFLSETEVNWCPGLGTVLANDEIVNGVSERGGHQVVRKKMMQWSMRITAYAQRLLDGLAKIDWPQPLKDSQTYWIGKSEGAMVSFKVLSPALSEGKGVRDSGYLTGNQDIAHVLLERAKEMRAKPTQAEAFLWEQLKSKKLDIKFRQQHLIDDFIVDFVCLSKLLIIEVDGKIHESQIEKDLERSKTLENRGYKVIRFTNEEVIGNIDEIVSKIIIELEKRPTLSEGKGTNENNEVLPLGKDLGWEIPVFTTRPDTIFGVSFMTLAPEHDLVSMITTPEQKAAVEAYIKLTAKRSELERMADVKTISGVFTGAYALHPFSGKKIPIWIGDYVLAGYGTGAVMAVPCGDQRDYDFAKHFNLEIPNIFEGVDISEGAYTDKENSVMANSDFLNGLPYKKALKRIIHEIEERVFGYGKVNYRLRDAVFSRQRYWGEPFPVYYKNGLPQMIDLKHLPIVLPDVEKYLPTEDGKPPLGNATVWAWDTEKSAVVSNQLIDHKTIFPLELNTMPGWAGSSSYFNRYMDPHNTEEFVSEDAVNYWQDVDLYIGGSEHATGHLLYSRFWQKFLYDKGIVPVDEYAKKLINQGMISGTSAFVYRWEYGLQSDSINLARKPIYISKGLIEKAIKSGLMVSEISEALSKIYSDLIGYHKSLGESLAEWSHFNPIHADVSLVNSSDELDIEAFKNWRPEYNDAIFIGENGEVLPFGEDLGGDKYIVGREVEKMSKSKYNVVNPDQICEEYGADSLRMFEMFLGPLEQSKPWKTSGISGVLSFLKKLWKLYIVDNKFSVSEENPSKEEFKILHKTIKKVEEDIDNFSFNTSVSTFMIAVNELTALKCNKRAILEPMAILLEPYAPHISEELWKNLGHTTSISTVDFPVFEPKYLIESVKEYPVSFNGKMRFKIELPLDLSVKEIENAVMAHEKTQEQLQGRVPNKVIIVPGKIINIVG
ncbi:MAG: leucine--tRNA ligase [Bacteroidetes bacterium HGW-Bacteroidetes-18]|nr:MAG: leucine--tRNA ligase [Bacteroidetes bacterium HGW-Bacteroidetes-18]